jgi:hypothetical protein
MTESRCRHRLMSLHMTDQRMGRLPDKQVLEGAWRCQVGFDGDSESASTAASGLWCDGVHHRGGFGSACMGYLDRQCRSVTCLGSRAQHRRQRTGMGSTDFFLCGLDLLLFFEEQLGTEQRLRVKTASGHAADFIDFGLGGRGGGREGGYAQRCRWCRAMDTNGILNRSTKPMPGSCCSCMLAPGPSVLGAMMRGMCGSALQVWLFWAHSTGCKVGIMCAAAQRHSNERQQRGLARNKDDPGRGERQFACGKQCLSGAE